MKLTEAETLAQDLVHQMTPYCERLQIAGSIRRRKADVRDIEIVAVPRWELRPNDRDLFGEDVRVNALLEDWAAWPGACGVQWIKPGTDRIINWPVRPDGRYWRGLVRGVVKLDIFLPDADQWGLILAIRTGSAEFSRAFVTHGKTIGLRSQGGHLVDVASGERRPTPEEPDVFRLLGLPWVDPQYRTGPEALRLDPRSRPAPGTEHCIPAQAPPPQPAMPPEPAAWAYCSGCGARTLASVQAGWPEGQCHLCRDPDPDARAQVRETVRRAAVVFAGRDAEKERGA